MMMYCYIIPSKAKATFFFCLFITASSLFAQSNYIYKITPEDTCLSWNDEILEVNNRYYLLSHVYHGTSLQRIPTVSIYDEYLNKIEQFSLDINGIDYGPVYNITGFTRFFYKENHFYVLGFITSDTNWHEAVFFGKYDEDFRLLEQTSIYPTDAIEWKMSATCMTKNNEFLLLFSDYDSVARLLHLNINGEVLQELFIPTYRNMSDGVIVETDSHYIAHSIRNGYLLRFPKDSLENYEWIEIEQHYSELSESMAIAVGNQIICDNVFYKPMDECPRLDTYRSVVFLNEDLSFKNRLIFGNDCTKDGKASRNIHYLTPDSIYYAYIASIRTNFWEHGGSSICIANFSSEGELHFNHVLTDIKEDSFALSVSNCKALSNGGVLVAGIASRFDDVYPFNSRGYLLLYHPTKVFTNINEHVVMKCTVFPNPARSHFTVTNTENANIQLYNMQGQKIKQLIGKEENTTIQTNNLSAGMYVLKVEKENAVVTKKVQVLK